MRERAIKGVCVCVGVCVGVRARVCCDVTEGRSVREI